MPDRHAAHTNTTTADHTNTTNTTNTTTADGHTGPAPGPDRVASRAPAASRRGLLLAATGALTGTAVLSATGTLAGTAGAAPAGVPPGQATSGDPEALLTARGGGLPRLIDVHHHAMMPVPVREWLVRQGLIPESGGPLPTRWDIDTAVATMDEYGVQLALVSAAIPAAFTRTPPLAVELTTIANNSLSEIARARPDRFGWLATIPLLDAGDAVREINRVYDDLGADGVLLTTHVGARYLGDPAWEPVLAALDARAAVALVHPFDLPGATPIAVPAFLMDYAADTARAAAQLVVSGALDRRPRIRWILAHGGGAFPYFASRLALGRALGYGADPETVRRALRHFWYDTAGPMSPYSTPSLVAAAGVDRILFGSDYNMVPASTLGDGIKALGADPALNWRARSAIARGNALRLFPTLAARLR